MIDDGLAGKFDIIITKTVSRFGRNTPDTLSILRKLKEHHIDVYFETENLHSCDGSNEFLISIIEAIAQAESENRSANVKWGIRRSADNPTSPIYSRPCYGYRKAKTRDLEICTEEAEVVKMIFSLYLQGYSIIAIKKELEKQSIKTPTGKLVWPKRTIETILGNEKYTGDVLVYKTYCDEFPSKKRIINKGQHSKLLVNDLHPVIIDKKTFEEVQNERMRRSNIRVDDAGIVNRAPTRYSMKKPKRL